MELGEFSFEIEKELKDLNISIDNFKIKQFYNYMNMIIEWNEKINLTAITDKKDIIKKHFIDSLTIIKHVKENDKLVDVGTGAGFPGIPLKIVNSNIEITLLDSLNKRINFLNEVIEKLELRNIKTIHSRVEDFGKENREEYDVATSRAVAPLNILLEYLLPLVKVGGICICMKGSNVDDEIKSSEKCLNVLGGKIEKIEELQLPESDIKRNIVIIRKTNKTPEKYPRKAGMASKEPII